MIKLKKTNFDTITPLTKNVKHNKALIHSIIEGNTDGDVFVDNIDNPSSAFIAWEFSFLLGEENDTSFSYDLYEYIFNTIVPNSEDNEIILFEASDNWPHLNKLFEEKGCITIERKMFAFDIDKYQNTKSCLAELPQGLSICAINNEFVTKYNIHQDIEKSPGKFGFCLTEGTNILSECVSVAVGARQAEIDISTDENHRKKGYATIVASAFIDYCIQEKITPIWSCWPEREASIALANKLGFDEIEDIPVILWAEDL